MNRLTAIKLKTACVLALFAILPATQAEVPDAPLPKHNKFAVELFRVESTEPFDQPSVLKNNISIENLFEQSGNRVHAYPLMYSELGAAAVCDQTEAITLAADHNLVNGKVIPVERKYALGVMAEITILNLKSNIATYKLDFSYNELKGFDEYVLKDEITAKMPFFETWRIDTELSQSLGSWLVLGGFSSSKEGDIQSTYFLIRITKSGSGY